LPLFLGLNLTFFIGYSIASGYIYFKYRQVLDNG